jgi:ubiquinone biosynthesis protein COQ4
MKRMVLSMIERVRSLWRTLLGYTAALRLLRDPNRLEAVFVLDRALPRDVAARIVETVGRHENGRQALAQRPRVALDLAVLRAMPAGCFGRAVADFYDENGLTPSAIPSLESVDEQSYVQAHLYETHDVWHVAAGFGTTVAEELGLQAVYAAQIPGRLAPLLIAGGLVQAALWVHDDFGARLAAVARGFSLGKKASALFGIRWEEMWALSVDAVRARLGLAPPEAEPSIFGTTISQGAAGLSFGELPQLPGGTRP